MKSLSRFAVYAWIVLAYNLLVILWGAYVRATGSGAACGSHWPLCNGQVVPRVAQVETLIEFAHRLTSGASLLLVVILLFVASRLFPKGYPARLGAALSMFFIITEALVGAGLVSLIRLAMGLPAWIYDVEANAFGFTEPTWVAGALLGAVAFMRAQAWRALAEVDERAGDARPPAGCFLVWVGALPERQLRPQGDRHST